MRCTYPARRFALEHDIRFLLVQSDADSVQFKLKRAPLLLRLSCVQHDKNEIGSFGSSHNLSATATPLTGTFYDTWKI